MRHGTISFYMKGCRCPRCTRAAATYFRNWRDEANRQLLTGEIIKPHGHYSTYINYRCRCEDCRAANTEYSRQYRAARRAS